MLGSPALVRALAAAAAVTVALWIPWNVSETSVAFLTGVFLWAGMAAAWGVVARAGYVSLATAAWFGLGAYSGAVLMHHFGLGFVPAAIITGLWVGVASAVIGAPLFRLRTHYFIMGTFLMAELIRLLMAKISVFGLEGGRPVYFDPPVTGDPTAFNRYFYFATLIFVVVALVIVALIGRSRMGFGLRVVAQDESTAELLGVPTARYKLLAFGLSSGLIAVAGAINGFWVGYLQQTTAFSLLITVKTIVMAVAGGLGTLFGTLFGATAVQYVEEVVGPDLAELSQVAYGLIIILIIVVVPRGLAPAVRDLAALGWQRAAARVRRRDRPPSAGSASDATP